MKKIFFAIAASAISASMDVAAQNLTYTYDIEDEYGYIYPPYGSLRRVSPNGLWATGGDDFEQSGSFIIDTRNPENIISAKYLNADGIEESGLLLDIDNNGMAVGTYYEKIFYTIYEHAGIFKDGKWTRLPEPEGILGRSQAVAISEDSKIIAGHAICANINPDEPGRFFPVVWTLNETTGEYEVTRLYNDIYVPGTLGFFVYDMTPNAKYICGVEPLDFSDLIAVVLNVETGEIRRFHDIEYKQVFFDNVGGYYDTMFVDGVMDGFDENEMFYEILTYATDRYMYGSHAVVSDVKDDGTGTITNYAAVYDIEEDRFIDGSANQFYLCGIGTDILFTNSGEIIKDGKATAVSKYVATTDPIAGIYSVDTEGKVITGSYVGYNAIGDMFESPVLVLLDDESQLLSIKNVSIDTHNEATVKTVGHDITVDGTDNVRIYNLSGALISTSAHTSVAPGTYIVVAGDSTHKVIIR